MEVADLIRQVQKQLKVDGRTREGRRLKAQTQRAVQRINEMPFREHPLMVNQCQARHARSQQRCELQSNHDGDHDSGEWHW
jgi:hypothetical protein